MKETKVYVDELPKCCEKCRFCYDNRPYWKSTDCFLLKEELDEDEIDKKVYKNCLLHNIQDHDKELVAKVLDKVKFLITKYDLLKNYNSCAGSFMLDKIIDQIQKEFEK